MISAITVDLGGDQRAREIVTRAAASLSEHAIEILEHAQRRLRRGFGQPAHALVPVHHGVGPGTQRRPIRSRNAEQLADHVHREPAREIRDEIAAAAAGAGVEVLLRDRPDPRLELRHAARREAARDERAHARVARRIHRQERHGGVGLLVEDVLIERYTVAAREDLDVLEGSQHVRVTRERPEAERLVAVDGRLVAQRAIEGIGVLVDLVGIGVVLDHALPRLGREVISIYITSPM